MRRMALKGKKFLITGGAKRIGREIALHLAANGAHIALHFNRSSDSAEEVQQKVRALGVECELFGADLSDFAALGTLIEEAEASRPLDGLVWQGELAVPMTPEALAAHLSQALGRQPLHVGMGAERIRRVGWCSGAAQGYIAKALDAGLDAFISGEISEPTTHTARECGIHYYAAGHHATERYGVKALGQALADKFGIEHRFVDCDNPV